MKHSFSISIFAVVLILAGAVILVIGDGGASGPALVTIGIAVTALLVAEKRRHRQAHRPRLKGSSNGTSRRVGRSSHRVRSADPAPPPG